MTLVVAIKCKDGLVMASDGQAIGTAASGMIKHDMRKIFRIGSGSLLGASGTIGIIQKSLEIVQSFSEEFDKGINTELRRLIRGKLSELCIDAQNIHRQYYGSLDGAPIADIIICARDAAGKQRIWHIGKDGNDEYLDDVGYACTGSGDAFAYTILRGLDIKAFDMNTGKLIAYKAIRKAGDVGASGLGDPIDIWSVGDNGVAKRESAADMEVMTAAYSRLMQEETMLIKQISTSCGIKVGK
ncbi:MAG: hypothetical protein ACREBF_03955 [Candidatus Micrarchaeales archaeon]